MKSGFVALLGRPNVGKSTLLNCLVGEKLAIVSDKPQTTRHRVLGIRNCAEGQIAYVDTPGVHRPLHRMNVRMVGAAVEAMRDVDLPVLIVDASTESGAGDRYMLDLLKSVERPVILALNKVDVVRKESLLPLIDRYSRVRSFAEIVPVSALDGTNVARLEQVLLTYLPDGPALFPEDYRTDQSERTRLAEAVREQVLQLTRDELPFSTAVVVERVETESDGKTPHVYCTILVERPSQKAIVIGRAGAMIKAIGTAARQSIEGLLGRHVYLDLHVKVRSDWRDDDRALDELGLEGS